MPQDTEHQPDPIGDAAVIAGVSCIIGGIAWIYPPGGLIAAGLALLAVAFARSRS